MKPGRIVTEFHELLIMTGRPLPLSSVVRDRMKVHSSIKINTKTVNYYFQSKAYVL